MFIIKFRGQNVGIARDSAQIKSHRSGRYVYSIMHDVNDEPIFIQPQSIRVNFWGYMVCDRPLTFKIAGDPYIVLTPKEKERIINAADQ